MEGPVYISSVLFHFECQTQQIWYCASRSGRRISFWAGSVVQCLYTTSNWCCWQQALGTVDRQEILTYEQTQPTNTDDMWMYHNLWLTETGLYQILMSVRSLVARELLRYLRKTVIIRTMERTTTTSAFCLQLSPDFVSFVRRWLFRRKRDQRNRLFIVCIHLPACCTTHKSTSSISRQFRGSSSSLEMYCRAKKPYKSTTKKGIKKYD